MLWISFDHLTLLLGWPKGHLASGNLFLFQNKWIKTKRNQTSHVYMENNHNNWRWWWSEWMHFTAFYDIFDRQRAVEGSLFADNREEVVGQSESAHAVAWCCWLSTTYSVCRPRCLPTQVVQWSWSPNESCRYVWLSASRLCCSLCLVYLPVYSTALTELLCPYPVKEELSSAAIHPSLCLSCAHSSKKVYFMAK